MLNELTGLEDEISCIRQLCPPDKRIAFVSGNFNILHPGHLRLLNFARACGDFLVVGVMADNGQPMPETLRLESIRSVGAVDHAFILRTSPEEVIRLLQPHYVIKGKEHEARHNPELEAVESYGGKLMFSSGETTFSSIDLLRRELQDTNFLTIEKPTDFPQRHGFRISDIAKAVRAFAGLRVVVIGDLIVDEYINCEPLGMSQEDPTLVVMPLHSEKFVGGAGIVAAHARGMKAEVDYFCVVGEDASAEFASEKLDGHGVRTNFIVDKTRITTTKTRYRAKGKTLLRVSKLRQHDIDQDLIQTMFARIRPALERADLLIFSDFNYGCLPTQLVEMLEAYCSERNIMMVADSQASSQYSDVSRFQGMHLLTPTEHEARIAVRDFQSGLVVLAERLRQKAAAAYLLITLGAEGLLIHAPAHEKESFLTDRLPAFNNAPRDVAGAGDSLLTVTSMALAVGCDIWQASYLGSVAAACQVSRVGNKPLTASELMVELSI